MSYLGMDTENRYLFWTGTVIGSIPDIRFRTNDTVIDTCFISIYFDVNDELEAAA